MKNTIYIGIIIIRYPKIKKPKGEIMDNYNMNYDEAKTGISGFNPFMTKVFLWMFAGLFASFATAFGVAHSPTMLSMLYSSRAGLLVMIIVEFALVIMITNGLSRYSYGQAAAMFMIYSVINGFTMAYIFIAYNIGTISVAFITASLVFAAMAIQGAVTKRDLSRLGSFLMMVLFGVIIAMLVNFFVRSSAMDLMISIITVFIFAGLTAWDMQKLQTIYKSYGNSVAMNNVAIMGALALYLDFINMFLRILYIFGRRD